MILVLYLLLMNIFKVMRIILFSMDKGLFFLPLNHRLAYLAFKKKLSFPNIYLNYDSIDNRKVTFRVVIISILTQFKGLPLTLI